MPLRTPSRWLKIIGVVAALGMVIVDLVGFLDAQTGSALGCGRDWPLCNGHLIPSLSNEQVIIEFSHRVLVGGFALVAGVFLVWSLIAFRQFIEVKVLAWLGIAFIIVQSGLGALAVVFVNPPTVLALHLGFGLLAMVGTVLLAVFIFQLGAVKRGQPSGLSMRRVSLGATTRYLVIGTWLYTYGAIYWGSYVAFRGGGEACPTWPLCNGKVFPGFQGLVGLDFIHRLLAVGLAILAVILLFHLRSLGRQRPDLSRAGVWFLLAVLMQIASGANLALSRLATGPYMLHITTLMFLFGILSYLGLEVMPAGLAARQSLEPDPTVRRSLTPRDGVVTDTR